MACIFQRMRGHPRVLIAGGGLGGLAERLGIELVEASPERVVGTMPVAGNTQPLGLLHGGASAALAETLASIGAALHAAQTSGGFVVGVDRVGQAAALEAAGADVVVTDLEELMGEGA